MNNKVDAQTAKTIVLKSSHICYTSNLRGAFDVERLRQHFSGYCLQYFDEKSLQDFYILLVNAVLKPKELDWASMMPRGFAQRFLQQIKSNPVSVYSAPSNEGYLGRLRTLGGMPIKWNRVGSTQRI